ncbi:unnamed protein product [Urochloa decumbens]|uniref:Glycosyltransferases n=1 Tax=Urochloa decumbens TaxID=240449 RepID=A0ABC9GRQ3_9POAL
MHVREQYPCLLFVGGHAIMSYSYPILNLSRQAASPSIESSAIRHHSTTTTPLPADQTSMASPKQQHKKRRGGGGVLRRAMLHSCLCFLVGLLTGLAPSDWADAASRAAASNAQVLTTRAARAMNHTAALLTTHYQLYQQQPAAVPKHQEEQQQQQQLVIAITTTAGPGPSSSDRERRSAGLTRTAHALRLVSPPVVVVWLVVEPAREAPPTAALLRRTGLVYRHLTYADNFTAEAWEEERHHQRNVALRHVEQHRLRGVVLFAGLADVYDLRLLDNLRHIRTLGAWPVATVWEQEGRVAVQGPLCRRRSTRSSSSTSSSSTPTVSSWFSAPTSQATTSSSRPAPDSSLDLDSGFAFASYLLWDPARWDRFPTSEPDHSHDSIDFVHRLLLEDYNKTRPIPDCSHIMAWRVDTTLL